MYVEVKHPCVEHKMALLRDRATGHKKFRQLATEITMFVCYEALKNVALKEVWVRTPIADASCRVIANELVVVPVLRAGVGMLEGILGLVPTARVGFVGLYRDEETKVPVEYYQKMPRAIHDQPGGYEFLVFQGSAWLPWIARGSGSGVNTVVLGA